MNFKHDRLENVLVHGPLLYGPTELNQDSRVVVAFHGSGGSATGLMNWTKDALRNDPTVTIIAPDAAPRGRTRGWWQTAKTKNMDPGDEEFRSAIDMVTKLVDYLLARGVRVHNITLIGMSQGAFLVLEYITIMHHYRFNYVMAMSGGLTGLLSQRKEEFAFNTSRLNDAEIYLSIYEDDPVVPYELVKKTKQILRHKCKATVKMHTEPGENHKLIDRDKRILALNVTK